MGKEKPLPENTHPSHLPIFTKEGSQTRALPTPPTPPTAAADREPGTYHPRNPRATTCSNQKMKISPSLQRRSEPPLRESKHELGHICPSSSCALASLAHHLDINNTLIEALRKNAWGACLLGIWTDIKNL
ncbi:hypothetical protein SUGI_0052750 [Cryptomeria japonica]|nr:hypothetical protein SUGI_0052750 [Cryptomeria japonica]